MQPLSRSISKTTSKLRVLPLTKTISRPQTSMKVFTKRVPLSSSESAALIPLIKKVQRLK